MLDFTAIITPYKDKTGGILQAFHAVQDELNYLPREAIIAAACVLAFRPRRLTG